MVVNTTPPAATDRRLRRWARLVRLHRRLAKQVLTAGKGVEELVVQVVAVGEHDDGGVLHGGMAHDGTRVESHGQALPRPLGMPHHTDATVSRSASGPPARLVYSTGLVYFGVFLLDTGSTESLAYGISHSVELVVAPPSSLPRHRCRRRRTQ